jgi:hypothetical protein
MSETTVGSIIGTLRLSITDFETNIAKAQEMADRLDGKNVVVDVKVDSAGAETKLAAVAASEDKVDAGNKKVASSSNEASKGLGLMSMAIVGLGPAIVPLAAGAAGLAVGFGAMGAAGILAIVGISREMKAGTPLGGAYTSMLGTLSGDLTTLGHTAAAGVLGPFQQEVANLQGQMPQLNSIIGEFSVITGKTAANLISGLVQAFITLEPLARDVGVYVLDLSSKFAAAMSGPGVVSFGDYIRSVFPQVMQSVESIVTAAVHLVTALAPLGMGTLGMLKTFSDLISALPVDVLANLATVAAPIFVGFKAFGVLSAGVTAFGTALGKVGVSAETAATGMRALNIASGAVGAVIAIAMFAFTSHAASVQADQDAVNSLTDALIRSKGVIDQQIISDKADALAKDGTLAAAKALGYGIGDVTLAALGNLPATARVVAQSKLLQDGWDNNSAASRKLAGDTGTQIDAFDKVNVATKDGVKITGLATAAAIAAAAAKATDATTAGTLTTATLLGLTAQQQLESQYKSQTAAIKALNATMDEEISRELTLAGATSNLDQATLTMTETLKKNKLTMDEHTQAGIDDRRAIEGVVGSLQSQRDANIKAGDSTAVATTKYEAASAALLDQTGKMYGTTSQAYKYMKQLLAVPTTVKTDLGITGDEPAKKKIDGVQQKLDHLGDHDYSVNVNVLFKANSSGPGGTSLIPGIVQHATGGEIGGTGTGTSDSNLIAASVGEHMLTADDVKAAGGHDAIYAWRKSLHGYAGGGAINISLPSLSSIDAGLNASTSAGVKGFDVASMFPAPSGGGGGAGGAAQWASMVVAVLAMLGQPASSLAGNLRRINLESGGNANAINRTDSNAMKGTPSMGLMQTIIGTFLAYAGPFAGRGPYDPFASIYAGDNYAIHQYGSVAAVDPLVHPGGYDTGGMMMPGGVGKNYGPKAERWLSGDQTQWFEAGRAAAGGSGGVDMSGVRADLANVASEVRGLGERIDESLQKQTIRQQTMQRQMARA